MKSRLDSYNSIPKHCLSYHCTQSGAPSDFKNALSGTSLVVQWLRLCLPIQLVPFDPWLGAKIPQASQSKNQYINNRSSTVTNS